MSLLSAELIVIIALTFFVLVSVVAGAASLYLLKIANDRKKLKHESEQSKERDDGDSVVREKRNPVGLYPDKVFVTHNLSNESFVTVDLDLPEDINDQIAAVAESWERTAPVMAYSEEWRKAFEASGALENIRMVQGTLDLTIPYVDHMQLISKGRPEYIEDLFRDAERHSRSR